MILDYSFEVLHNFRNSEFRNFCNKCFAVSRHVSQIMFSQIMIKYEFGKVSQIFLLQFYICFARLVRFRKYEFHKVSQSSVSQAFANRFFVSQV